MGMGVPGGRMTDATFDLNLAPVLDIIVSIVPLLLLSVAFVQVKMIETPVPQVVQEAIAKNQETNPDAVSIRLNVSKERGFTFVITEKGKPRDVRVALKNGSLDFSELEASAYQIKTQHPQVFRLELAPEPAVSFDEIVQTMDRVRRTPAAKPKVTFADPKTGQKVETELEFPNVIFANVAGE